MRAADDRIGDAAADARAALALLAVDPRGLGGVRLRVADDDARLAWTDALRGALSPSAVVRRIAPHADHAALLGDVDVPASLAAGRRVLREGLLARADGGVIELSAAAETPLVAALLARALDGEPIDRGDGTARRSAFAVVAWTHDADDAAEPTAALDERLALHVALPSRVPADLAPDPSRTAAARARLAGVMLTPAVAEAICRAADRLGVRSVRAAVLAARAARAAAALEGRESPNADDLRLAARLVLAPRAARAEDDDATPTDDAVAPPPTAAQDGSPADDAPRDASADDRSSDDAARDVDDLATIVVAAARAAIPRGLAAVAARDRIGGGGGRRGGARARETRGAARGAARGPLGRVRRDRPRGDARLDVVATLAAAAPWQRVRRPADARAGDRVIVLPDDLRVRRRRATPTVTTVVVVDASGSAALHRLAEAKGAVELLLAESYVRRERVALVSFRGRAAEVLLPPTRAVARARRVLAGLAGGGGTPLAAGLARALDVADEARRGGRGSARWVLLTDGRANVALDGRGGRAAAERDALAAAAALRTAAVPGIVVDISPRGEPLARAIATRAGAAYVALPTADARGVHVAVRALDATPTRGGCATR